MLYGQLRYFQITTEIWLIHSCFIGSNNVKMIDSGEYGTEENKADNTRSKSIRNLSEKDATKEEQIQPLETVNEKF